MKRRILLGWWGCALLCVSAYADSGLSSVTAGGNFYSVLGPMGTTLTHAIPLSVTAQVALHAPEVLGRQTEMRLSASYLPYTLRNGSGAWLPTLQILAGVLWRAQPVIWKIAPTLAADLGAQASVFQSTSVYSSTLDIGLMPILQLSPGVDIPVLDLNHTNLGFLLEAPVQFMVGRGGFFVAWNGIVSVRWRL